MSLDTRVKAPRLWPNVRPRRAASGRTHIARVRVLLSKVETHLFVVYIHPARFLISDFLCLWHRPQHPEGLSNVVWRGAASS